MSEENQAAGASSQHSSDGLSDGMADAIAAVAVMGIVLATVVYWLGGFPG